MRTSVDMKQAADSHLDYRVSVRRVGERFRLARRGARLSLRQMAERAGVAASTIHKIETGRVVPSLAVCIRLSDALDRRIAHFVDDDAAEQLDVRFVPHGTGRVARARGSLLRFEYVAEPLVNPRMEGFVLTVAAGGKSGAGVSIRYRGEEIVYGLEGRVRFVIRGQPYDVGPGDTLHLKGTVAHRWENIGTEPARLLMICAFAYEGR
ncbi:MAG: helix-turn-helix domain-containing protein [Candidatus Binatia bacterium]